MKLLVDMNLAPAWCDVLRQAGWDAVHWSEVGNARATDREILDRARRERRIVFTHDLDFGAILAASAADGPSVVQVRAQDVTPAGLARTVVHLLQTYRTHLEEGALLTLDEDSARVRILPLRGRPSER